MLSGDVISKLREAGRWNKNMPAHRRTAACILGKRGILKYHQDACVVVAGGGGVATVLSENYSIFNDLYYR
jgi:hypothetical protein